VKQVSNEKGDLFPGSKIEPRLTPVTAPLHWERRKSRKNRGRTKCTLGKEMSRGRKGSHLESIQYTKRNDGNLSQQQEKEEDSSLDWGVKLKKQRCEKTYYAKEKRERCSLSRRGEKGRLRWSKERRKTCFDARARKERKEVVKQKRRLPGMGGESCVNVKKKAHQKRCRDRRKELDVSHMTRIKGEALGHHIKGP